ncbi:hypothetical protein SZN_09471 [Streptomyces zinciresistens K42]|uniref:Uncharacterized protein n=1 Tax=Streptomyces zinciresistens K42 TaxID=700597 RepID=G2G8S6_9ACTN|nr:hypothetical protein [Streptomyces zinciresistens]EGX60141.1 hypothetical protein SZN_09471 [Streptomyces zinciresistens K42]
MTSRIDILTAALRQPVLLRPLLGQELREALVQGLGPGSSEPRWTATLPQLAESLDTSLTRAEEKDTPTGSTTAGPGATSTAHALVLETDAYDYLAACSCGHPIGRTPKARSVDVLVCRWEQHAARAANDSAWSYAVASLPTPSIGAS